MLLEPRARERGLFRADVVKQLFAEHRKTALRSWEPHLATADPGNLVPGLYDGERLAQDSGIA